MRTAALMALAFLTLQIPAHAGKKIKVSISYVSGTTIYINAGRLQGVTTGDTAKIIHAGVEAGTAVIAAISDSSSALKIVSQSDTISIGDTVITPVEIIEPQSNSTKPAQVQASSNNTSITKELPRENILGESRDPIQFHLGGRIKI